MRPDRTIDFGEPIMHLKKQIAKPRRQRNTADKEKLRSVYDKCPKCRGMKAKIAKQCHPCKVKEGKTVVSNKAFKINGKLCRLIPLTRGQAATVYTSRHRELSQFEWYSHWSTTSKSFYAVRNITLAYGKKTLISMHRQIVGGSSENIDHKNRNTLDNRDENLRPCTVSQNLANSAPRSKSGFKGVYHINKNKIHPWHASITVKTKNISLGNFSTPEEGARVYDAAARKYHGEFARVNFP